MDDFAVKAMLPFLTEHYANPSGLYSSGKTAKNAIEMARGQVASLARCLPEEVIFTGSGTEADNTALYSAMKCAPQKRHIVVSSCEHPAVSEVATVLKNQGYQVTKVLPNREGVITADKVSKVLRPDTALVSIMAANNETGVVNDVYDIGKIVKNNGSIYHIDATQIMGKLPMDFKRSLADYMVFSAHKFHGQKGVGILVVKQGTCYFPLLLGGSQERKCRAGTENVPGIVAAGVAAQQALKNLTILFQEVQPLRNWIQGEIKKLFGPDVLVLGERAPRTPNTLMVALRNVNARQVQDFLNQRGIAVGTGSACSCLKKPTPSDTIKSMGIPLEFQIGTLRISLSKYNAPRYGGSREQLMPFLKALADYKFQNLENGRFRMNREGSNPTRRLLPPQLPRSASF